MFLFAIWLSRFFICVTLTDYLTGNTVSVQNGVFQQMQSLFKNKNVSQTEAVRNIIEVN